MAVIQQGASPKNDLNYSGKRRVNLSGTIGFLSLRDAWRLNASSEVRELSDFQVVNLCSHITQVIDDF
jgi:hypothetical protein